MSTDGRRVALVLAVTLMWMSFVASISGCARTQPPDPRPQTGSQPAKDPSKHRVQLPDGTVIEADKGSVAWQDVDLSLTTIGFAKSNDPIRSIIGNHSVIVTKDLVDLKAGKAALVLVERSEPAASGSVAKTYEYWLIVNRDDPQRSDTGLAYSLVGVITGDQQKARAEMLTVGQSWVLPF